MDSIRSASGTPLLPMCTTAVPGMFPEVAYHAAGVGEVVELAGHLGVDADAGHHRP